MSEKFAPKTKVDRADMQKSRRWRPYGNIIGRYLFHCGAEGYLENKTPTPEDKQEEIFFDRSGKKIDANHEYCGCQGTANEHDGHRGFISRIEHAFRDAGGIRGSGWRGFTTSMRYYLDCSREFIFLKIIASIGWKIDKK